MHIELDYAYNPRKRAPNIYIKGILENASSEIYNTLDSFSKYRELYKTIPIKADADETTPFWVNGWLPALDAISIYGLIADTNPSCYLEVGSGNSTKFARKAIQDNNLKTKIISIDPTPRAVVDSLCDEVIRTPLENLDVAIFSQLPSDTVVFVDNSHRSFQNSDVSVFFTEILPLIPNGIVWGLHDIFLPYDYPQEWVNRFYNEQYLLTSYLLGGGDQKDKIILANAFACNTPTFKPCFENIFKGNEFNEVEQHGGCFFMKKSSLA